MLPVAVSALLAAASACYELGGEPEEDSGVAPDKKDDYSVLGGACKLEELPPECAASPLDWCGKPHSDQYECNRGVEIPPLFERSAVGEDVEFVSMAKSEDGAAILAKRYTGGGLHDVFLIEMSEDFEHLYNTRILPETEGRPLAVEFVWQLDGFVSLLCSDNGCALFRPSGSWTLEIVPGSYKKHENGFRSSSVSCDGSGFVAVGATVEVFDDEWRVLASHDSGGAWNAAICGFAVGDNGRVAITDLLESFEVVHDGGKYDYTAVAELRNGEVAFGTRNGWVGVGAEGYFDAAWRKVSDDSVAIFSSSSLALTPPVVAVLESGCVIGKWSDGEWGVVAGLDESWSSPLVVLDTAIIPNFETTNIAFLTERVLYASPAYTHGY